VSSSSGGLFGRLRPTAEERRQAIEDPGEPWHDWFYSTFLKVWIALGFLIVDGWIAGADLATRSYVALGLELAGALYVEYVAFRYFWSRPSEDESLSRPFHRTWYRPFRFGRWTPYTWYPERFRGPTPGRTGPDPNEFL
jgi:hypothetical protein